MKYDRTSFEVKAGEPVELVFVNDDFMQHNVLILEPETLEKVGAEADKLAMDPSGTEKEYVPDMPEVLFFTIMVNPEESNVFRFVVHDVPGDYALVCIYL